tara:strand:- start:1725 stop:1961 length:237 start_codon:yes stop_codon:yes gene_type:complete
MKNEKTLDTELGPNPRQRLPFYGPIQAHKDEKAGRPTIFDEGVLSLSYHRNAIGHALPYAAVVISAVHTLSPLVERLY